MHGAAAVVSMWHGMETAMSPYCRKQCCDCCAEYMYGLRLCTDWQEDEEDGAAESELEDEMEDEVSLWHGLGAVSS